MIVAFEIKRAFDAWEEVSGLAFTRVFSGDAEILISFSSRNHTDRFAFDGPSGVLAHAFFPNVWNSIEGDAHFDEDELWTANIDRGKCVNRSHCRA